LLKSEIGQKIYSGEARQAKWYSFLVDTKKRLADVLHADFDQVAYDSFTAASKAGVRDLLNSSFQAHGTYEFDVEYFGQERKMSVTPLSEVPAVMCEVLLRQVVVNTGQVQPMPWEKHIIDALGGHIPNLPTGVRVQTSLISDFVGGRQVWRKALASCRTWYPRFVLRPPPSAFLPRGAAARMALKFAIAGGGALMRICRNRGRTSPCRGR